MANIGNLLAKDKHNEPKRNSSLLFHYCDDEAIVFITFSILRVSCWLMAASLRCGPLGAQTKREQKCAEVGGS
jgi:hypothetical protein